MSEQIVDKIQKAAVRRLNQMTQQVINGTERQIVDAIGDFKLLSQQSEEVLMRFVSNLNHNFDELMDRDIIKDEAIFDFETLSLVQEEELDVIVALEGMVNAARNEHLAAYIGFNTRLSSLFPRKRLDESTNPLDPEQLATAFQEALRPLALDAHNSLAMYRAFNREVLKKLDEVIQEANSILVDSGVLTNMAMEAAGKSRSTARNRPRPGEASGFGTIEEESFDDEVERPELFSVMQDLLHFDGPSTPTGGDTVPGSEEAPGMKDAPPDGEYMIPAGMIPDAMVPGQAMEPGQPAAAMRPFQPQEGQTVHMVDQAKLMEILSNIQEKLGASGPGLVASSIEEVEKLDISQSLGEILQESQTDGDVVNAVDRQSSDIINLVTLLYEAIWQDPSVPVPIKELIGRTQITIIKVALADVEFFNNENHPARAILNEFASAGIGWTEVESLTEDPLYQKIRELVERILTEFKQDNEFFEELIKDFREFQAQEVAKTQQLEQRILKASERNDRLDDIHQLVSEKVEERILGRELHPFVEELLKGPFNKFMVMLVLKEGPGSNAWKQAINTIDVMLWSVQPHEQDGDRDRLETINPRLLNNLRKALRIATIDVEEIDELIAQLQAVQDETFLKEEDAAEDAIAEDSEAELEFEKHEPEEPVLRFHAADEESADTETEPVTDKEPDDGPEEKTPIEQDNEVAFEFTPQTVEAEPESEKVAEEEPENEPEEAAPAITELAAGDPALAQVDNLSVGMWVEFAGEDDNNTRCKLAAKISAIDKFIFVNRQGVKVVEKTKMGLALELHDGTVSIISDGLLFSRALESVIGNLRDSQQEQHTGSAYQPSEAEG